MRFLAMLLLVGLIVGCAAHQRVARVPSIKLPSEKTLTEESPLESNISTTSPPSDPPAHLPSAHQVQRGQLLIHSDFPLPETHRLINDLVAERDDIAQTLAVPVSDEPIHVYLFDNERQFRNYLQAEHPQLPWRRAFFLENDTQLSVLAFWGERVGEDLRHEVAHGYLHAVLPRPPLWLDEGLAEYFEVVRGHRGFNTAHVVRLSAASQNMQWRPLLERLESITSPGEMKAIDYAEAWLWIHWMLHTTDDNKQLLQAYLTTLREEGVVDAMAPQIAAASPRAEPRLLEHLNQLTAALRQPSSPSPGR